MTCLLDGVAASLHAIDEIVCRGGGGAAPSLDRVDRVAPWRHQIGINAEDTPSTRRLLDSDHRIGVCSTARAVSLHAIDAKGEDEL